MIVNQRIAEIIKHYNLNANSFAVKIGTSDTVIRNILKERNYPSFEILVKILQTFDCISIQWLVLGAGEMLKKENKEVQMNTNPEKTENMDKEYKRLEENYNRLDESFKRLEKDYNELKEILDVKGKTRTGTS